MATRIKRIYKGIKYMTQIFVVKEEREIEIGAPTDVKHIAHIGWEGSSGNPPSWMNEFKTKPKAPPTPNNILNVNGNGNGNANGNVNANVNAKIEKTKGSISWSSQDFESLEILDTPPVREILDVTPTRDIPKKKKKKRRQSKSKSMSIPNSINTTRPVATKSKTKLVIEGNARPESIQVI